MYAMTFEEWCKASQDLDRGAIEQIETRLRSEYDAQLTRDQEQRAAWKAMLEA